jgi:hypothetical protein
MAAFPSRNRIAPTSPRSGKRPVATRSGRSATGIGNQGNVYNCKDVRGMAASRRGGRGASWEACPAWVGAGLQIMEGRLRVLAARESVQEW